MQELSAQVSAPGSERPTLVADETLWKAIAVDSSVHGPITEEQIATLIAKNQLTPDSIVCLCSAKKWKPLSKYSLFAKAWPQGIW